MGGVAVITNGVFTAEAITTPLGNQLKITGYDTATGKVTYTYTLLDDETHPPGEQATTTCSKTLQVVLTDNDGDPADGHVDGAASWTMCRRRWMMWTAWRRGRRQRPRATCSRAWMWQVVTPTPPDGAKDTAGADGVTVTAVTGVAAGTVGQATAGQYGVLTLNADGSYSYVRNANAPGKVSDVFTYTITDGDGDTDTATLTITLDNSTPTITDLTPEADGGDVTVQESGAGQGQQSGEPGRSGDGHVQGDVGGRHWQPDGGW